MNKIDFITKWFGVPNNNIRRKMKKEFEKDLNELIAQEQKDNIFALKTIRQSATGILAVIGTCKLKPSTKIKLK